MRTSGNQEKPVCRTKANPQKRPPQQLLYRVPPVPHALITMHQAWQAVAQLFGTRVTGENIMLTINLKGETKREGFGKQTMLTRNNGQHFAHLRTQPTKV
jgi:hypothetical protein